MSERKPLDPLRVKVNAAVEGKGKRRQVLRVLLGMIANAERRAYYTAGTSAKVPANPREMQAARKIEGVHIGEAMATLKGADQSRAERAKRIARAEAALEASRVG